MRKYVSILFLSLWAIGVWADDVVYINHDLTEAQVGIFYSIFSENYNIIPSQAEFRSGWAFQLFEKDTPVWAVHMVGFKITPNSTTTSKSYVERAINDLGVVVQRIF